jgi:sarcosine oxidase subunit beta
MRRRGAQTERPPSSSEAVVIGAGVIGGSIAYHLARAGMSVAILEAREVASAASGASAGGVRQQGRDPRELPLALTAIARWPSLGPELEADLDYHQQGHVTLVETDAELAHLRDEVSRQQAAGLGIALVDREAVRVLAPGIGPTVIGGSFCPTDGHADPMRTTRAFVAAAVRLGATLAEQTTVAGFNLRAGRIHGVITNRGAIACETAVVAAGAWSATVAAMAGVRVPVAPMAPQMIVTEPMPPLLKPVLGAAGRRLSLKQLASGRYLIGGGWPSRIDLDHARCPNLAGSLAGSARDATAIWPLLRGVPAVRAWAGLEGATIDEVPVIDRLIDPDGLVLACGFTGHGFALSPAVGEAVAGLVLNGESPIDIGGLRFARFAGLAATHAKRGSASGR